MPIMKHRLFSYFLSEKKNDSRYTFNLVKYFSIISLIFMVIASISLGQFYQYLAIKSLISSQEADNVKMARFFSASLWTENLDLFLSLKGKTGDETIWGGGLRARTV